MRFHNICIYFVLLFLFLSLFASLFSPLLSSLPHSFLSSPLFLTSLSPLRSASLTLFFSLLLAINFFRWSFWSFQSNCPKREPGWSNNDCRLDWSCIFWHLNKAISQFLEIFLFYCFELYFKDLQKKKLSISFNMIFRMFLLYIIIY